MEDKKEIRIETETEEVPETEARKEAEASPAPGKEASSKEEGTAETDPKEEAKSAEGAKTEETSPGKKDKKGFFKGKGNEKLERSLKEAETRLEEARDKIQRQMAEFDNFRKRTEKEKAASFEVGARSVIEKLLPVVDSFERGLASLDEADKEEPFETGMLQVYKQLEKILEELEVKPIPALGQPFNAELHNAVMHVEDGEAPENTVVEEFQKGYTYRGTVVRYSMVKVAN